MPNTILRYWQDGPEGAFKALFDTAPILMQSIDFTGRLVNVSAFWAEKLGYARDDMIGRSSTGFLTDASRKRAEDIDLPAFFKTGQMFNVDYDYVRKNGDVLPVQQSASAQFSPEGEFLSSLVILFDNSEIKRLNAELSHNHRMKALGQLVGGVAHDFNNILTVIKGNTEFIKHDPESPCNEEHLRDIISATDRGATLTQLLLSYGQKSRLDPVRTDLSKTIQEMEVMLHRVIPNKLDISIVTAVGLWGVYLDPHRFETALINLVNNARDAMPKRGTITIETCNVRISEDFIAKRGEDILPGRYVMLSVSDTGMGIRPDITDHIYEPYFTTKSFGEGSGLGLSMVFGFAKQSGGMVRFYTEEGFGTTFKLYFPAIPVPTTSQTEPIKDAQPTVKPKPMAEILLVEDEHDVRHVLAKQIERGGYTVSQAASGDAALTLLLTGYRPKVLVTDIIMPGALQGPELAEKARDLIDDLKVIFVSGMPNETAVHKDGIEQHDAVLIKPFNSATLMREIAKYLR